jgi:hypothetical protein
MEERVPTVLLCEPEALDAQELLGSCERDLGILCAKQQGIEPNSTHPHVPNHMSAMLTAPVYIWERCTQTVWNANY